MPNKDYGQTFYPSSSAAPNPAADMEQLAESLEGRTVRSFSSTTARDDAFATLTSGQKNGVLAHVMGKGLYYWSGSVWRYVSANGETFTQSGTTTAALQPTGLALISFPTAFGGVPNVTVQHATTSQSAPPRLVRVYTASGYVTPTFFHVHVVKPDGSVAGTGGETGIDISWTAVGPRGAD